MAGDANVLTTPWPGGEDGLIVLQSCSFDIAALKTKDFIVDEIYIPFAFTPVKVILSAQKIDITGAITFNIQDNESTPQELVTDETLTAIADGAGTAGIECTIDDYGPFLAGGYLYVSYGSAANAAGTSCVCRIYGKPYYASNH